MKTSKEYQIRLTDKAIGVFLEQLAGGIEQEINAEQDVDRNCRLQDAKELLRQAWHLIAEMPCEPNDLITKTTTTVNKGK